MIFLVIAIISIFGEYSYRMKSWEANMSYFWVVFFVVALVVEIFRQNYKYGRIKSQSMSGIELCRVLESVFVATYSGCADDTLQKSCLTPSVSDTALLPALLLCRDCITFCVNDCGNREGCIRDVVRADK